MLNEFILPGLIELYDLNAAFIQYCYENHNYLKQDYEIFGIYGNAPFCIWNGETSYFSENILSNDDIERILYTYNSLHVNTYLNCTNTEITENMTMDTYSNILVTNLSRINASNHIVINSPILEKYLIENYKNLFRDIGKYNSIKPNDIHSLNLIEGSNLFINPTLNNDFELIKLFPNKKQLIFTLNPNACHENCNLFNECLLKEHISQITFDPRQSKYMFCKNWLNNVLLSEIQKSHLYINPCDIEKYNNLHINHFILEHHGNIEDTLLEYINFLIKEEYQSIVFNDLK